MTPRLKQTISKEIEPTLKEKFGYKILYMGPRIQKIVLNMGLGLDGNDQKILKSCQEDLANITGQMPVVTKFKKSVANFKTRKNNRAKVKGINMVKKHVKTTKEKKGGIVSKENFIHLSNLAIFNTKNKNEAKK